MPKISVIMPVYNVEKYLRRSLDSVLKSSFMDFEVICVNDGSPDKSLNILEEYAAKDSRIKIVTQENQGLSMARNNGLKLAQGEYIYFFDSDDAIHPELLNMAYNFALKHNADLVCFGYEKSDGIEYAPKEIKNIKYKISDNPLKYAWNSSKLRISFNVWTKFYKKSLLDGTDFIKGIYYEDYPHTFAILSKKPRTVLLDAKLYFYTLNMQSISNQKITLKQIKDFYEGIKYVYSVYNKPELVKELKLIRRYLMPKLLKNQLKRCVKAPADIKEQIYKSFSDELKDLFDKDMVSVLGCGIVRYIKYRKIVNKYPPFNLYSMMNICNVYVADMLEFI